MVKLKRLKRLCLELESLKLAVFNDCALVNWPNWKIYKAVYQTFSFEPHYTPCTNHNFIELWTILSCNWIMLSHRWFRWKHLALSVVWQLYSKYQQDKYLILQKKRYYLASTNFCEERGKFIGSVSSNCYPLSFLSCNRLIRSHDWTWAKHCTLHGILLKHKRNSTVLLSY